MHPSTALVQDSVITVPVVALPNASIGRSRPRHEFSRRSGALSARVVVMGPTMVGLPRPEFADIVRTRTRRMHSHSGMGYTRVIVSRLLPWPRLFVVQVGSRRTLTASRNLGQPSACAVVPWRLPQFCRLVEVVRAVCRRCCKVISPEYVEDILEALFDCLPRCGATLQLPFRALASS